MKTLTLLLFLTACSGCANAAPEPGSLAHMKHQCAYERSKLLMAEWSKYETDKGTEVVYPNWRMHFRRWAMAECKIGQRIPDVHPPRKRQ